VLIDGWPIAHHVFAGNRKDPATVDEVVQDLQERFGLQRIVFVGDWGMTDGTVRKALEAAGRGYLAGCRGGATRRWRNCWRRRGGRRWLAVHSPERLGHVESCFAQLKDVIELRPVWHRTAERVRGHMQVAALALLLQRMLDRHSRDAGLDLSAHTALRVLQTVRVVEFEFVEGGRQRVMTKGSELAEKVLKALKIRRKPPPRVPDGASETTKISNVVTIRK